MSIQKGSVLVHDGTKLTILPPGSGDVEMIFDPTEPTGIKWKLRKRQFKVSTEVTSTVTTTTYSTVGSFSFDSEVIIKSIKIVSRMESGITSYDLRIFDTTNSKTLAEVNFANTSDQINDMGTLSNIPVVDAIFEIQAKRNGGNSNKKITIRDVSVSYN